MRSAPGGEGITPTTVFEYTSPPPPTHRPTARVEVSSELEQVRASLGTRRQRDDLGLAAVQLVEYDHSVRHTDPAALARAGVRPLQDVLQRAYRRRWLGAEPREDRLHRAIPAAPTVVAVAQAIVVVAHGPPQEVRTGRGVRRKELTHVEERRIDGSLRQEADARGTRSARSDQQGNVCRHGPTATGVSHRISTPRRCSSPRHPPTKRGGKWAKAKELGPARTRILAW